LAEDFEHLYFLGRLDQFAVLRQALLDYVAAPWCHAAKREADITKRATVDVDAPPNIVAFDREATEGLPAATLVVGSWDGGGWVYNIVPQEIGELTDREYRAILSEFSNRIAEPAAKQTGFQIDMRSRTVDRGEIPALSPNDARPKRVN